MLKEKIYELLGKDFILPQDRARTTIFTSEIEKCLSFFEKNHRHTKGKHEILSIHSNKITLGRIGDEKKGYFLERDILDFSLPLHKEVYKTDNGRVIKTRISYMDKSVIGRPELINEHDLAAIIDTIQSITIPYKEYIKEKEKKHS